MNQIPDVWGPGQLLAFSGLDGKTDFQNGLCLRSSFSGYEFQFMGMRHEKKNAFVRFTKPVEKVELTGDMFHFYGTDGAVSSGVLADAWHLLLQGTFEIELTDEFASAVSGDKTLIGAAGFFNAALLDSDVETLIASRTAPVRRAVMPPGTSEASRRTALKALSMLKTQVYSPAGRIKHRWSTPDRWPHRRMWLWDSAFHAIGARHYDAELAKDFINAMFDLQRDDGFITHSGDPESSDSCRTQPPVLSLAMRLINEVSPDPQWIAMLAPKLERYVQWLLANRDTDGNGLLEWRIDETATCRSGESGMDNSPRFDGAIQLDAPDFNSFVAFECESLAMFLPEKRDFWLGECNRLRRLISERLWNREAGFFMDYDVKNRCHTGVMASAGFLPLFCGAATPEQAARLVEHLNDPATFGTPLRIPSIAASNTAAYQKDMWRGPVWINVNYLICRGLERYGYCDLAQDIIAETMAEEEKFYLKYGTFFEFYDDRKEVDPPYLERKGSLEVGGNPYHQSFHDYGWSGTLYLEMLNRRFAGKQKKEETL